MCFAPIYVQRRICDASNKNECYFSLSRAGKVGTEDLGFEHPYIPSVVALN